MESVTQTTKIGHRKMQDAVVEGVYVALYQLDKIRSVQEPDGSTAEQLVQEQVYLLKLPGKDRKLWLKPAERRRALKALQMVDEPELQVESGTEALEASSLADAGKVDGQPQGSEPSFQQRLEVHRIVEWMRQRDAWPDPWEFEDGPAQALELAGVQLPTDQAVQRLLIEEVQRRVERRAKTLADHQMASWLAEQGTAEKVRGVIADPLGELEGGRPVVTRLLYRSVRPDRDGGG